MDISLTEDQCKAFENVKHFLKDKENPVMVLMGSAGVGKTTLTKYITDYIMDNYKLSIVAIAPTHKARRVLSKKLNKNRIFHIPNLTVASVLGKMREHSYIGTHKYTNGSKQKMDRYNFFILDEVSMVADSDLDEIVDYICLHEKKLLLIGDNCQIPSPSQQIIKKGNICYKPDSSAFEIANLYELRTIVRQSSGSIIIKIATFLRDNLWKDQNLADILHGCEISETEICIGHSDVYHLFSKDLENKLDTRIIAYTNEAVRSHNLHVRKFLEYTSELVIGELLTGYSKTQSAIENGTDYKVLSIKRVTDYAINNFKNLVGNIVTLADLDDETNILRDLFFVDIQNSSNVNFLKELVSLAEIVNKRYSTKEDYRKYCELKNRSVFIEDIYKYSGRIVTETNLRQTEPLLFTRMGDVVNIKDKSIINSELTCKLEDKYGEIIEYRLKDNKAIGDSEVFADQYKVVEKDVYYGYSITSHKSQGSTYDSVYVDENDFNKITNRWNHAFRVVEHRHKEKNQLKYVAYTRASKSLKIMI